MDAPSNAYDTRIDQSDVESEDAILLLLCVTRTQLGLKLGRGQCAIMQVYMDKSLRRVYLHDLYRCRRYQNGWPSNNVDVNIGDSFDLSSSAALILKFDCLIIKPDMHAREVHL